MEITQALHRAVARRPCMLARASVAMKGCFGRLLFALRRACIGRLPALSDLRPLD